MKTILIVLIIFIVACCGIMCCCVFPVDAQSNPPTPTLAPTMNPGTPMPFPTPAPLPEFKVYLPMIKNGNTQWELYCHVYVDTNWCVCPETRPLVDDPYSMVPHRYPEPMFWWYDPTCTKGE